MFGGENLIWCGNDVPVIEYTDKLLIIGPKGDSITLDVSSPKTQGLKCLTEADGLRIINSDGCHFLERVQDIVVDTFKIAAITPAAKLLNAIKSVDFGFPRADEIIRDLGKDALVEGIETLLDIA